MADPDASSKWSLEQTMAIEETARKIFPFLADKPLVEQSMILAELLARFLAGHFVHGDAAASAEIRASVLRAHLSLVEMLIPDNARQMGLSDGG